MRKRVIPASAHQLRELRGVAEHVGQPELGAAAAELSLEPALAVRNWRTSDSPRRQVAVGLHPPRRRPASIGRAHRRAHAGEQLGRALLQPRVVLRLRVREAVLGIRVHQPQLRRRRAHELAPRLLQRPQPRRVEVGVADRGSPGAARRSGGRAAARAAPRSPSSVKACSSASSSPAQDGSTPGSRSSAPSTWRSCHSCHAPASKRASSQPRSANDAASPWPASPKPNRSLHATSSSNGIRSPPAARVDERRRRPDHTRPGVEPLHRLAAEPQRRLAARVDSRSTRTRPTPPAPPPSRAASTSRTAGRAPRPAPRRDTRGRRLLARDPADRARDLQPLDRRRAPRARAGAPARSPGRCGPARTRGAAARRPWISAPARG